MEKSANNSNNSSLITVISQPSNTNSWSGSAVQTHILFSVKTGASADAAAKKRAPLNLAIVLDRSGSMASEKKLENAKEAIIKVIENLSSSDVLHLVVYGSNVAVIFEAQSPDNKERLIAQVKTIRTEGCTNLWGGVEKAAELLKTHSKQGYTSRMFLFSDGQVNQGLQDKKQIQEKVAQEIYTAQKIKVSSFGLGSDFDEALMKGIAEYGNGTYFFIAGSESIPTFVNSALSSLLNAVALEAVLHVRPGSDFVNVEKIYAHSVEQGIRFGDLQQNNTRTAVACIKIGDGQSSEQLTAKLKGKVKIVDWELDYNSVPTSANDTPKPCNITGSVYLDFTDDSQSILNGENNDVQVRVVLQQTAEIDSELVKLVDAGQTDEAKALATKQIELLESVLPYDENGTHHIATELKQAKASLEKLSTDVGVFRKEADHRGYRKRRASITYDALFL